MLSTEIQTGEKMIPSVSTINRATRGRICQDIHHQWTLHYYTGSQASDYRFATAASKEEMVDKAIELGLTHIAFSVGGTNYVEITK